MTLIDPRTAVLMGGLMSGLMAVVLYALKRSYPASIKGLGEWSLALALVFVGGMLGSARDALPDVVSIALARTLMAFGVYGTYLGTQRFFGLSAHTKPWLAVLVAFGLLQLWFTAIAPNFVIRLGTANVLVGTIFLMHAVLIIRQRTRTLGCWLAATVMLLMAALQFMRLAAFFIWPMAHDLFDTSPQHLIYVTSFAFCILLFSISTVLMATDRLRVELEHLAHHDSLTNAFTRRHMDDAVRIELERCHRHGRKLCLLMIDMDHFKSINDQHGHQAGDKVLIDFVSKVNALLRRSDQLGRFGGEEFVLLLPETTMDEALAVADRIRELCAQPSSTPSCTVSIGVTASYKDTETVDTLLARADAALYRAKANGRNRVESG